MTEQAYVAEMIPEEILNLYNYPKHTAICLIK